jgi:cell division protein FtsQ
MKGNIKKIMAACLSVLMGTAILVLLIAAINKKNNRTCSGFSIQIKTGGSRQFIEDNEVLRILTMNGDDHIVGKTISSFDLRKKEELMKRNSWVRDAQAFFDNNGILRVKIAQTEPLARIFTKDGESFYLDSNAAQLPLTDKLPAKVPVFTGYPHLGLKVRGQDSILNRQVISLSQYILKNPFWMAQIEQINVNPDRTFELVPAVGDHLVGFGDGSDMDQKFHRLLVFYKEVMSKTGLEKYSRIDVRYNGEVVATRRGGAMARVDSLKAAKNIEQLIRSSQQVQGTDPRRQDPLPLEHSSLTEKNLANYDLVPDSEQSQGGKPSKLTDSHSGWKTGRAQLGIPSNRKKVNNQK